MDEMFRMLMFGGGMFGSGIDLSALIAFLVFGVVYLLVPVLGYQTERPRGFVVSLYALIAYGGVSLLQLIFNLVMMFNRGPMRGFGGDEVMTMITLTFPVIKLIVFLIAMLEFVRGLRGLRLYRLPPDV